MKICGTRVLIVCTTALLLGSGCASTISRSELSRRTGWKTHCFGRYLVDLPPTARVSESYKIRGNNIDYLAGESPDSLKAQVAAREAELRSQRHGKIDASMLLRRIEHGGSGVTLLSWKAPYSTALMWRDSYLISEEPWQVFRYSGDVSQDRESIALRNTESLAKKIRSRADGEIPQQPGFCIEKGLVVGKEYQAESFSIGVEFPEHPNARVTIDAGTGAEQDRLLDRADKFLVGSIVGPALGLTVLRKGRRPVGSIEAQEYATAASDKGQRVYAFAWEAQGSDRSLSQQNIAVHLQVLEQSVVTPRTPYQPAFQSDKQAIQLWDAIIDSIRLRPGAA
ncbi:T6SS immunity protein Tli4 family protein [Cupriavidus sp. HPC(L)]|uniref:T6SS immunity protein Tli4 family protein n=1 Tax=Cupriavidus sp. HPC(L) TaxID=1217418 RepID=UPI00155DC3E7|nr:T6SS immunity protein Tli4 family protein [Cupriavidus sp. HPC(L)]